MSSKRTNPRRGGSAVEFALTLPVLFGMVLGMLDYGAFFSHEALVVAGLNGAVLAGAQVAPEPGEPCDECVRIATAHAAIAMENLGQVASSQQLMPRVERVSGVCALVLETTLAYEPLIDFMPVPQRYDVSSVAMLVHVDDC